MPFFFLFNPLFSFALHHPALPSLKTSPHLLSFVLLLILPSSRSCVSISGPCVSWKQPSQTQAEPTWIRSEKKKKKKKKSARLYGPDPHLPLRLAVTLSRDLLPTRPCWIPAICSTALAFKCLIEPLISWTVAVCVYVCVCVCVIAGGGWGMVVWESEVWTLEIWRVRAWWRSSRGLKMWPADDAAIIHLHYLAIIAHAVT